MCSILKTVLSCNFSMFWMFPVAVQIRSLWLHSVQNHNFCRFSGTHSCVWIEANIPSDSFYCTQITYSNIDYQVFVLLLVVGVYPVLCQIPPYTRVYIRISSLEKGLSLSVFAWEHLPSLAAALSYTFNIG